MKYAHWTATAALLALGVYGAIPSSAEGWYTPSKGFTKQGGTGTVYYGYDKNSGTWQTTTVTVDENGNLEGGMNTFGRDYELRTAYEALVKACYNKAINDQQDEMIQTIGKNLDSVFRTDGIKMEMTKHGPGGDETTVTYTLKIKPGEGGNAGSITAEDPTPYGNVVDGRTIGWTRNDENGQLQLYGSTLGPMSTDQWWADDGFVVPFLKGGSVLGWKRFGGIDKVVFESRASAGDLTLKGFHSDGGCSERLTDILTEESSVQRDLHQIVCRYGTGDSAVIHYLPIGSVLPSSAPLDDKSVTTNDTGRVHIVDVGDAVEGQVLSSDGAAGVAWVNPSPVVSYDDVDYYLTITPGGNDDTGDTYVPLPYAYIEETEEGYVFTYRLPGNMEEEEPVTIPYSAAMLVDDKTITTNDTGLAHLVGIGEAKDGQVPCADGKSGIVWRNQAGAACDDKSVTTNGTGKVHLVDFGEQSDMAIPYKSGAGAEAKLGWSTPDGFLGPSLSYDSSTKKVNVAGWRDNLGAGLYLGTEEGGDWGIHSLPVSIADVAPDGKSIEMVIEGSQTNIQIAGWKDAAACSANLYNMLTSGTDQNRGTHMLLCHVNGTMHYLPIGDGVIPRGSVYDDKTITTNGTGAAHLVGIGDAALGQIAYVTSGAGIRWDNPPPEVSYDLDSGVVTITPGGDDDSGDTTITLPKIYIEETEEGYTFTYRDLDSEEADPITIPKAGGVKFDDVTLTTNETGEAHIVGYSDDLGAGMYLGTDVNGSWGVHQMPTNTVGVEDITTGWAPDDGSGIRKVNLKNWNYSYNGTDPLFLVNDGGALAYVPLLGSNTVVKLDNVSIWSNEVGEVEIKGFSNGDRGGCTESTADILVADTDETETTHEFLARATSSGGDATLHYVSVGRLPHPDDDYFTTDNDTKRFRLTTTEGKFLVGAADNGFTWVDAPGSPVDGVSIVTNAQGHAGQAAIAGFWDASEEGDVLTRTADGVAWRPASGSVDDLSIVTNTYGKLGLKGYELAAEGDFPVVGSDGALTWASTNSLASSKFSGSFSYINGHIHDGCVMVGRTPIFVSGMDASDGNYRIRVTVGTNPTAVLEQGNGFTGPSGATSYIPVYSLSNGEIVGDYRGSFVVPSYE